MSANGERGKPEGSQTSYWTGRGHKWSSYCLLNDGRWGKSDSMGLDINLASKMEGMLLLADWSWGVFPEALSPN